MKMKKSILSLCWGVLLIAGISACSTGAQSSTGSTPRAPNQSLQSSDVVGSTWNLLYFRKSEPIPGTSFTLQFTDEGIQGNAGCNHYFGAYQVNGEQISISDMGMTEMACLDPEGLMDQEQYLLSFLSNCVSFKLQEGLLILARADGETLTFEPME
jgi:heat shock protein HslJ